MMTLMKSSMRKESSYTADIMAYMRNKRKETCAFEIKVCQKGNIIAFSRLEIHQKHSLLTTKHASMVYKISDQSMGYKPYDCFSFYKAPAYVIVGFDRCFVGIDIDVWLDEEKNSIRKSLTAARALEIASFYKEKTLK